MVGSRYFVAISHIAFIDDHHSVGDPGQELTSRFVGFRGQVGESIDEKLVICLRGELVLEPGFEICLGMLISFPVEHFDSCKQPVSGKPPEGVCHIGVGDGVSPVIGSGQVVDSPDENNRCDCILAILSEQLFNSGIFYCSTLKTRVV